MDPPPPTPFAPHLPKEKHDSNGYNDSNGHSEPNGYNTTPPPPPAWRSLIPTGIDLFTASVYPATLLLGSVYSTLSPDTASTDSYFSRKSNFANIFFVKYGWLWTTLVFALHLTRLRSPSRPQALLRYALATLWWVAVTQWFFGAPIMDRTFTLTGGACRAVMRDPGAVKEVLGEKVLAATSAACKLAGGRWRGGHDLSGHTFLLTHASLFLWSEVMPVLRGVRGWRGWRTGGVVGLLAVWWWMLLMTGVYFHTWREKLTGWIVSMVQWCIVYVWALKTQPQIRDVVGVPSV